MNGPYIFPLIMPLAYVSGDPQLTHAQALAVGHNARARTELGALETELLYAYPAAFAAYRKQCRSHRIQPGMVWIWRESKPWLVFMVVRESAVGATRMRFVQSTVLTLARDYRLEGITSLALAPLGTPEEWPMLKPVVDYWLGLCALPIVAYQAYVPGVLADEVLPP